MSGSGYAAMDPYFSSNPDPSVKRIKLKEDKDNLLEIRCSDTQVIKTSKIFHMSYGSLLLLGTIFMVILISIIAFISYITSAGSGLVIGVIIGGSITTITLLTLIWLFQEPWIVDRQRKTISYKTKFKTTVLNYSDITKFFIEYDHVDGTDLDTFVLKVGTDNKELVVPLILAADHFASSDSKVHWVILKEVIKDSSLKDEVFNDTFIDIKRGDFSNWGKGKAEKFIDSMIVSN